jgi:hypothetical protein
MARMARRLDQRMTALEDAAAGMAAPLTRRQMADLNVRVDRMERALSPRLARDRGGGMDDRAWLAGVKDGEFELDRLPS